MGALDQPKCILVVDDDGDSARALSRSLEHVGHLVRIASNSAEAFVAAELLPVDLVLCDVDLPDGDGLDVMRQLRYQYHLPCIAITRHALAEPSGLFVKHFMKPLDFEQLRRAIENVD